MKLNQRFGGTCRFHLHGSGIKQARNQRESGDQQSSACFAYSPTLKMVICSSDKSDIVRTTRHYKPYDCAFLAGITFEVNPREFRKKNTIRILDTDYSTSAVAMPRI
jgi:hypothetical protein